MVPVQYGKFSWGAAWNSLKQGFLTMNRKKARSSVKIGFAVTLAVFGWGSACSAASVDDPKALRIVDSSRVQILTTIEGSTLFGRIVEVGTSDIRFQTDLGVITIPIDKIGEIKEVPSSSIRGGQYWFSNPNRTRLYLAPTARMLNRGEGYFVDCYLFFPGFAWAITDNISFGGGVSLFPGLDLDEQLLYFTPKVGLSAGEDVSFAVGALIVDLPEDEPTLGTVYGVMTFGPTDASVTAVLGYGFADGELADKPLVVVGADIRLTRRTAFVTENWIIPDVDNPLVSYGLRFFGEKLSVDLALVNTIGEDAIFPGIPYVDFVYNF